ncbi:hypothetical protein V7x_45590 [Crateriforma conspicua]|uniref:Uncharacterized protein n=1 Tax=Crateriforma conspicua TaxID=2527996 RepID=A0A5C6FQR3_9PLAN|nr:hypothetical protein V7x_45590 [Crateriforma conspicua]
MKSPKREVVFDRYWLSVRGGSGQVKSTCRLRKEPATNGPAHYDRSGKPGEDDYLGRRGCVSGQDRRHHVAVNISQAKITPLEPIGQSFVIDAQ